MSRAKLTGTLWSPALIQCVVGDDDTAKPEVILTEHRAARAIYFAEVIGLPMVEASTDAGDLVEISDHSTLHPDILTQAASEVMGYFGRVPAEDLMKRRHMILSRAAAQVEARARPAPTNLRSAMTRDQVEVQHNTATHEGFFLTRTVQLRQPWFNGGHSARLTREVFEATDAALVLPYDPARDRVMLVEQFRMGPFGRGDPYPWVLEPVAGRMDAGESPEDTARRECLEEADLALHALEHISSHYCTPGCSTEMFHCFLGLADLPTTQTSIGGLETENEDIRRHVIAFDTAMDLTRTGEVNIGPLFAMLLWLERERPRLRARA